MSTTAAPATDASTLNAQGSNTGQTHPITTTAQHATAISSATLSFSSICKSTCHETSNAGVATRRSNQLQGSSSTSSRIPTCLPTLESNSNANPRHRSGACPSGLDREILDTAIDQHYLWDEDEEAYDQLCCYGCDKMFSSISRWLQHIESPACSEDRELNERVAVNVVGTVLRGLRYDYNLVLTDMYGYDL